MRVFILCGMHGNPVRERFSAFDYEDAIVKAKKMTKTSAMIHLDGIISDVVYINL